MSGRIEPGMALGRVERSRSVVAIGRRMRHRTRRREVRPPRAVVDLWPNTVEVSCSSDFSLASSRDLAHDILEPLSSDF